MAPPELARTESFQYPATHTGHLNAKQEQALAEFKKICAGSGYYKPANPPSQPYASHDNETLLRYLRARKFVSKDALQQFKETEDWRKSTHIDELYDNIDIVEYDDARKLYPMWIGRRDKRGVPVYVYEVANLTPKSISAYENFKPKYPTVAHQAKGVPPKLITLFALYENLIQHVLPFCSVLKRPHMETPMSQSANIVDISNVGLKTFWNLKSHMQDASQLATAHYPETLDRIFIIGAPSFFPTVWSWIKRWFDPITVSKIFILDQKQVLPTLQQYMDIEDIPKKYGGKLNYTFGDSPILEDAMLNAMHWTDTPQQTKQQSMNAFLSGPVKWRVSEDGKMEAVAVGSVSGKQRRMVVAKTDVTHQDMFGGVPDQTGQRPTQIRADTSTGTSTHPTEEGDPNYGSSLRSGQSTPAMRPQDSASTGASVATLPLQTSLPAPANNTHDLPAQPDPTPKALSPMNSQPREGTSSTRMEAQNMTHAAGQGAEATPHMVDYGHGEKAAVVEPSTVGQAPKDVYANVPAPEQHQETYMEQAQHVAANAYESAAAIGSSAVGSVMAIVGGKKHEEPAVQTEDHAPVQSEQTLPTPDERSVEEYLRNQYSSGGTSASHKKT